MKSRAGRWILILSVLTVLIGCRTPGVAQAADPSGNADASKPRPLIPPLGESTATEPPADNPEFATTAARTSETPSEPNAQETARVAAVPQENRPSVPVAQSVAPPAVKVARPTESIPTEGCVTSACHPGVKARPFRHGPVDTDACDACHEEADAKAHTFALTATGNELCESCHELELEEEHVHPPVVDGQCDQCHDPHGGSDRSLMAGDSMAATCAECHDDITEGMPFVHGPVAAGACTGCHRGHSSKNAVLLNKPGRDLCLDCHNTFKQQLDATRLVHGPVATDCISCHRPHAAEDKMMLEETSAGLCLGCHSDIESIIDEATVKHDAVTDDNACRNCHDPHGSDHAAMMVDDAFTVCLSCHDREIELSDGTSLAGIKNVLAEGMNLHGPVAQRNCVSCHAVHGGKHFRLLIEEYPPEFYVAYNEENYALCFACHESEVVRDANTTRLTNFRNGSENMHYLHVNRKVKGRTCRACHETHASNRPKHVREAVPFGSSGWLLPIGFEKTETGGRCSPGCHRPYDYDREKPVANVPTPKPPATPDASAAGRG